MDFGLILILFAVFLLQFGAVIAWTEEGQLSTQLKVLFLIPGLGLVCMLLGGLLIGFWVGIKCIFKEELENLKKK